MLTVLSVAYPLAVVAPGAVGGAEQVLLHLDAALVRAGHASLVLAQDGSTPDGELLALPAIAPPFDDVTIVRARERLRTAVDSVLASRRVDLVHLHGIDFWTYLPRPGPPVIATLHLPVESYPREALIPARPGTWIHAVSKTQDATLPRVPGRLPPVENGIDVDAFGGPYAKRNFALYLGRVCPEKGPHLAIDAAEAAGIPLLLAGEVQPYPIHLDYFRREIAPRLGRRTHFIGPVGPVRRRRLLAAARCLLVPSLIAETSSLVAREAAASGTAVVAFRSGALTETVEDGRTGFLVDDAAGMTDAILRADAIDPALCRAVARERFSLSRMVDGYLSLYGRILARPRARDAAE